jgi:hypothetical protein
VHSGVGSGKGSYPCPALNLKPNKGDEGSNGSQKKRLLPFEKRSFLDERSFIHHYTTTTTLIKEME